MRVPLLCLLVAVLSGSVAGAPRAASADPVAVVASVRGKVEVASARGGGAQPAAFGRPLERGDKVTVGKGGGATLLLGDGSVVTLTERSSITIGGQAGAAPRAAALPGEVFSNVSQFATAGSRQTGLVTMADMRADADAGAPLLVAPRNTAVLDDAPTLRWRAVAGARSYRVHFGPAAGPEAWTREVPAGALAEHSLEFPADAARLAAGADYEWEIEALGEGGTLRREGAALRVLAPDAREGVRANLTRISESAGGEAAAARFLAGSYLSGLGLYDDAARQFRELATLAPESSEPHEALGNLYLKVGISDWAAAEFRQALALQRKAR